jgi:hypothetical protein
MYKYEEQSGCAISYGMKNMEEKKKVTFHNCNADYSVPKLNV